MNEVRRAIFERLGSDTPLMALITGVHHQVAPQSAAFPFVVLQEMAATPVWQFQGGHIESDVWLVRASDRASSASRVEDIAARTDNVLTDAPLTVTGRALLAVYREGSTAYQEVDSGESYRHVAVTFRIVTQPV